MKDLYQSFATALQDLLPAGDILEITVPNRATRLLIVDYGEHRPGHSFRTLTDTTRRFDDLSEMSLTDIHFLGKLHRDDKPSFQSVTFECFEEKGLSLADPVCIAHHATNSYDLAVSHDEDGYRVDRNQALQRQLTLTAARKFKAFRSMGFFGAKAVKTPRPDLPLNRRFIDFAIEAEHQLSTDMRDFLEESYQAQLNFLRKCEQERSHPA